MTQETKDYIATWKEKISSYKGDDLGTIFDKYTALFTLYNRLYNESYRKMKAINLLSKSGYSDREKATKLVVEFNSAADIINRIEKRKNFKDLEKITDLLRKDLFHINIDNGVLGKNIDIELMSNLESDIPTIRAQATLSLIYNVRCNIVHGKKHFEEHQRLLLEPLIRILETIVELQIEKLS